MRDLLRTIRTAANDAVDDRILNMAAALAFYTALAMPPLLILITWLLGSISDSGEAYLRQEVETLVGADGASFVDSILESSDRRVSLGAVSGWIGLGAILFAASGVFAQLQMSLNRIWSVEAKPGKGLIAWLRKRVLSMGLVGVLAFLMLVSLAASSIVGATGLFDGSSTVARAAHMCASLVIFSALFAAVFKLLPDVMMQWRDVLGGALVTALLFSLSKEVIGFYLAERGLRDDYGAAGSAVVVLAWVYLSSSVLFFGAELTQAWSRVRGHGAKPNKYATVVERK